MTNQRISISLCRFVISILKRPFFKNKAVRKIFFDFCVFFAVFCANAIEFSISPVFSASSGVLEEKLYNSSKNHEIISLLEWERDIFFAGAECDFSASNFSASLSFDYGVSSESGEMRDSDWLNSNDRTMKTNYSVGKNESVKNFNTEIGIKYAFPLDEHFSVEPTICAQFLYDSFERTNAEGWYSDGTKWWFDETSTHYPSEWTWSETKGRYTRKVLAGIGYERKTISIWTGISASARFSKRFSISSSFEIAPLVHTDATDTHHGSETRYRQIQTGHFSKTRLSICAEYLISRRISIFAKGSAIFGGTDRGKLFVNGIENKNQPTGSTHSEIIFKTGAKFRIF